LQYYDRALALNSTYLNALYNKANVLQNLGRYDEALQYYDRALAIDPTDVDTLYNKALVLDDLDRWRLVNYRRENYNLLLLSSSIYINLSSIFLTKTPRSIGSKITCVPRVSPNLSAIGFGIVIVVQPEPDTYTCVTCFLSNVDATCPTDGSSICIVNIF